MPKDSLNVRAHSHSIAAVRPDTTRERVPDVLYFAKPDLDTTAAAILHSVMLSDPVQEAHVQIPDSTTAVAHAAPSIGDEPSGPSGGILAESYPIDEQPMQPMVQIPPQDTGKAGKGLFGGDTSKAGQLARLAADSLARKMQDSLHQDSLRARSSLIKDTTYVVDLDSTARLQQFTYERPDSPQVELFPDREYPLFGTIHSTAMHRDLLIDSTGTNVIATETMGGDPLRIPVTLSLHDYVALRRQFELHKMFADEARKTKQLVAKNDLGELLSNITKISIPIPPNPLFSIFGKNLINLNVTGAVDIKAGFRNTKSDQTTLSALDQIRNEPDFNQEVQVNVNGTIGDKLNILADWNTKRTVRIREPAEDQVHRLRRRDRAERRSRKRLAADAVVVHREQPGAVRHQGEIPARPADADHARVAEERADQDGQRFGRCQATGIRLPSRTSTRRTTTLSIRCTRRSMSRTMQNEPPTVTTGHAECADRRSGSLGSASGFHSRSE